MDKEKLNEAYVLHNDLEKIRTWIGDLVHINRNEERPYNPNKSERISLWKKLFNGTKIKATSRRFEIDPESIKGTYIDAYDIKNMELSIKLGFIRAEILEFMIVKLKEFEKIAEEKFKNA